MFPGNSNPFLQMPGKIVVDVQRKQMPSGQIVEFRTVEVTVFENGRWRRERVQELDPGTADGTCDIDFVRECRVCLRLWHAIRVRRCPVCGLDFDFSQGCCGQIKVSRDERIVVCAACAQANNMGLLERIAWKFCRLRK